MRKYVMMLCLVLGLGASAVKVSVDENVEFVSSMCRLAGFDEYVNNVNIVLNKIEKKKKGSSH